MEKLLRLLSNQTFQIEPNWGINKLNEIMLYNEMGIDQTSYFKDMKEQSREVTYVDTNGGSNTMTKDGKIAIVNMSGVMTDNDGLCHYGMSSLDKQLRSLYADSSVKGILLSVNSGGGYSTAGDILYNAIADKNKPVVVHSVFMASAAVKGTLKADEIIALSESTTIGSIGVMLVMPKWYIETAKEGEVELYSKKSPGKNGAWRALKEGNFEPYINELTEMDNIFMKQVMANRPLKGSESTIEETLDGRTFMAKEAKKRGLIDGIGSLNYALKRLKSYI